MSQDSLCRACGGEVREFYDFGRHPLSDAFVDPEERNGEEFFYRLAVGVCRNCTMVQLMEEVPRERMFHDGYPYQSSGSVVMRTHFEEFAKRLLDAENVADPFVVELGCNDGIMLKVLADAGVRHLGVEPSGGVADLAAAKGVRITKDFFEEETARTILADHGPADVIYAANTLCHIPYMDSILNGVRALLATEGVFVFEDPYFGDILERTSFDQIYDEHFFFFTARSVQAMAARFELELVDVERFPVHGGEVRYTLAHAGTRQPSEAVVRLVAEEEAKRLTEPDTLSSFGEKVTGIREGLTSLLRQLREEGWTVVGYGATAKSATVNNLCGIGPDLVSFVIDSTPGKQGRLTPGTHIPVREPAMFSEPYPDYALLFAWNHADEIMAKEQRFRSAGGKWILYVPEVRIV